MTEPASAGPGVQFTETMRGFFALGVTDDYHTGFERGEQEGSPFEFTVTVTIDDVERMIRDPQHAGRMQGIVRAPHLSPQPLEVREGAFHLLVRDPEAPLTRKMIYRLSLRAADGARYTMFGFKRVHEDRGLDLWSDTTTLYVDLHEGADPEGALLGKGIVHIHLSDFRRQLVGMRPLNARNKLEGARALARFGLFFGGALGEIFGRPLSLADAAHDAPARARRPLRLPEPSVHPFETRDGVGLRLTRYQGGRKGPVILAPGFGTPAASFTLDTTETNFPEFLVERGYDVWLLDYRASPELPSALTHFSLDDIALQDFPAAVHTVRERAGADSVQVMAYCLSSSSLLMSLASGLEGVRSAVASQGTLHPRVIPLHRARSGLRMGNVLTKLGFGTVTTEVSEDAGWGEKLFDQAIRLYPAGRERCNNPVCRRILFFYGEVYDHDQLNDATHQALHEIFGAANLTTLDHVAVAVNHGRMVTLRGEDAYLPHLDRLKLPLAFIHGERNRLFLPEGSELTYNALRDANGPDYYLRHVIPGYAHMDCFIGKNAARDVYGIVAAELDKHN